MLWWRKQKHEYGKWAVIGHKVKMSDDGFAFILGRVCNHCGVVQTMEQDIGGH